MNDKKALFFDFDGTLWFGKFGERTLQVLKKVAQNGDLLFLNTGRSKGYIPFDICSQIDFTAFLCGGCTIVSSGKDIFRRDLTSNEIECAINAEKKYNLFIVYEGVDKVYYNESNTAFRQSDVYAERFNKASEKDLMSPHDHIISKLSIFKEKKNGVYVPFNKNAKRELDKYYEVVEFTYYVECMAIGYNKKTIIKLAEEYFNIDHANTYAFGDSMNDAPMFEYCAHNVAIANSPDELKSLADFVTTEEENGIAEAIEHYGII